MVLLRSLIFDVAMYGGMFIMGILFAPAAAWSRDGAYWACKTYSKYFLWCLRTICGLSFEVRGTIPTDPVLVCSKHQSFFDIVLHMHLLPRTRYIMKRELIWAPIIGLYGMRLGSTPVSRGKKGTAVRDMVSSVEGGKEQSGQLVIYPQGTRTLPGQYLPYKVGAGMLYLRRGQACVPVATNVGVFWPRRSWLKRPGTAVMEFLDPIPPGMELKPFLRELEARIETASNALMEEAGFELPASSDE